MPDVAELATQRLRAICDEVDTTLVHGFAPAVRLDKVGEAIAVHAYHEPRIGQQRVVGPLKLTHVLEARIGHGGNTNASDHTKPGRACGPVVHTHNTPLQREHVHFDCNRGTADAVCDRRVGFTAASVEPSSSDDSCPSAASSRAPGLSTAGSDLSRHDVSPRSELRGSVASDATPGSDPSRQLPDSANGGSRRGDTSAAAVSLGDELVRVRASHEPDMRGDALRRSAPLRWRGAAACAASARPVTAAFHSSFTSRVAQRIRKRWSLSSDTESLNSNTFTMPRSALSGCQGSARQHRRIDAHTDTPPTLTTSRHVRRFEKRHTPRHCSCAPPNSVVDRPITLLRTRTNTTQSVNMRQKTGWRNFPTPAIQIDERKTKQTKRTRPHP